MDEFLILICIKLVGWGRLVFGSFVLENRSNNLFCFIIRVFYFYGVWRVLIDFFIYGKRFVFGFKIVFVF